MQKPPEGYESSTVLYRQRNGTYIIEDPERSNIIVIGKHWKNVVARAKKYLGVIIPGGPPSGGTAA